MRNYCFFLIVCQCVCIVVCAYVFNTHLEVNLAAGAFRLHYVMQENLSLLWTPPWVVWENQNAEGHAVINVECFLLILIFIYCVKLKSSNNMFTVNLLKWILLVRSFSTFSLPEDWSWFFVMNSQYRSYNNPKYYFNYTHSQIKLFLKSIIIYYAVITLL